MGAKKNKAKISPNNKGYDKWQCTNLPHEIIQLLNSYYHNTRNLKRGEDPLHRLANTATTKSWVSPTTRCSRSGESRWPQLYLSGNPSNTSSEYPTSPEALRMIDYDAEMDVSWIGVYDPANTVTEAWNKCESHAVDPFGRKNKSIEFTNIIAFEGKFYALSLQGALAVIEEADLRYTIGRISLNRAVPRANSRFFKEYFVIMNEEIFLVFLIHQKSLEIVDEVEVFRLCFTNLKWIKVERVQGKALIVGWKCYWVNSAVLGCREDCVYFTQGSENGWWLYDMESCCISPV